jgi:hypothetical protein
LCSKFNIPSPLSGSMEKSEVEKEHPVDRHRCKGSGIYVSSHECILGKAECHECGRFVKVFYDEQSGLLKIYNHLTI